MYHHFKDFERKMQDIRHIAQELGIAGYAAQGKVSLIRALQTAEGMPATYGTNAGNCPHTECCFRDDCRREYSRNRHRAAQG